MNWWLVMLNISFMSGPNAGSTVNLPLSQFETKEECLQHAKEWVKCCDDTTRLACLYGSKTTVEISHD